MELYIELAMADKSDQYKKKLFLYVIGEKGREVFKTLTLEGDNEENRTVENYMTAFENQMYAEKK